MCVRARACVCVLRVRGCFLKIVSLGKGDYSVAKVACIY